MAPEPEGRLDDGNLPSVIDWGHGFSGHDDRDGVRVPRGQAVPVPPEGQAEEENAAEQSQRAQFEYSRFHGVNLTPSVKRAFSSYGEVYRFHFSGRLQQGQVSVSVVMRFTPAPNW